jgi:hypothetical protein
MGLRTVIQKKILEVCQAGTFEIIRYDNVTKLPIETGEFEPATAGNVLVNEISGGLTDSASRGAQDTGYSKKDWNFLVIMKFHNEVDTDKFLTEELGTIKFNDQGVQITLKAASFQVGHPTTQGRQGGTDLTITITANTRR